MTQIIKRNGKIVEFDPNKILARIKEQGKDLNVDCDLLARNTIGSMSSDMTTDDIDTLIYYKAIDMIKHHTDYGAFAGKINITRHGKLIGIKPKPSDLTYNYISSTVFLDSYSLKDENRTPIELPSISAKRIGNALGKTKEEKELFTNYIENRKVSVASPIRTNSGTKKGSLISCNLTHLISDSREGIQQTLNNIAAASSRGAGIGLLLDSMRSSKSVVGSFNDYAAGIVRFSDILQAIMRFYKQGNRSGSAAMYLSLWHKDIIPFLELRLPTGDVKLRTPDLFTGVVVNDNFVRALLEDGDYYLFCPNDILKAGLTPLQDLYGEKFEEEYNKAVALGIGEKIKAKTIFNAIIKSQMESGTPYVFFKDHANKNNMQDNIGIIKQSNLCMEITQVSAPNYTPQCALGLIPLNNHKDLKSIAEATKVVVRMLNRVIDVNDWSDKASEKAGKEQRAIAIGVAGFADFLLDKKLAYTSKEAKQWNKDIAETIYKSAIEESHLMALEEKRVYPAWSGSRYEKGETYIKGWSPIEAGKPIQLLNSLFVGYMPSATTSFLLECNESFEPLYSVFYSRRIGEKEFIMLNKYLVADLEELGLWTQEIKDEILMGGGSIQHISKIPSEVRERYLTVFEISQRELIDMSADRQTFIDQSQSFNLHFKDPSFDKSASAFKYAWEKGLKTGSYYTRTTIKTQANTNLNMTKNPEISCYGGCSG